MAVPISQMWTVASYVLKKRLSGQKRYPLVLMLEPLFRCNLACAGCGKIQYPAHILKKDLSPEECFRAVEECGAPMVSIPGGEPLMHPQIAEIVEGLKQLGHQTTSVVPPLGGAQAIWIDWDKGTLTGGSDPRKDGCALGY